MEKTIQKLEGWINSNHHDIYSKEEYLSSLKRILEWIKEEQAEKTEEKPNPWSNFDWEGAKENLGLHLSKGERHRKSRGEFDEFVEIELGHEYKLEINIDEGSIIEAVIDALKEMVEE